MQKVKTSKHSLLYANVGKADILGIFLSDYGKAVRFYINYLWNNKVAYKKKIKNKDGSLSEITYILDIKSDKLDCPSFISTVNIPFETDLSARALRAASSQACSIVSSAIEKRKRKLYVRENKIKKKERTRAITNKINNEILVYPNPTFIYPELDSLCSKIEKSNIKYFDVVLTLSSLGKRYGKIIIPFRATKHSRKLESKGTLLSGISLRKDNICLRWSLSEPEKKTEGITVGGDTGINSVVTLSDKQKTPVNNHNQSLNTILTKISRKVKGSKGFDKAIDHRDNFINWSINQLNFANIKQVNLEKISNFRKGKNVGKFLNYMGETLIRSKLLDTLQEQGVLVKEETSAYRSQRCSCCGYVQRENRKNKMFSCKHCFFQADADYNASCNHEQDIPSGQFLLWYSDIPKKFFWKKEGFFNLDGSKLTVSVKKKFSS